MADASAFSETNRMLVGKNYHFFNHANHSSPTDFPDYYGDLLSQAEDSVKVWDPYFNAGDEDLFTNVQPGVDVTILYMYKAPVPGRIYSLTATDVKSRVAAQLPIGHGVLKVAYLPNTDTPLFEARKWHDRFLIIDDLFVFLVGSSLAYQHSSARCFGIYDISEDEDASLVLERFEKTLYEVVNRGYVV